jgi:uncharacterized 2Fe-2S/4Fe-4S cluster protein (DUF4445 family)
VASGIADHPQIQGLIDIGTNGEIAIGNNEWLVCCSASAGPSFEGGGTRCGMRATRGAIERVEITDGRVKYRTIANAKPRGLCGSGIIDCIYELVRNRIIGSDGKFHRAIKDPRLTFEDGIPQYVIAEGDEAEGGKAIVFTEPDISNLIKSKGSIFSAIKALLGYTGLSFDQLETFYVAGGFGNYLNIPKAIAIGLCLIFRSENQVHRKQFLTGARLALTSEEVLKSASMSHAP